MSGIGHGLDMAHEISISSGSKEEKYMALLPQIRCLIDGETDLTARMANITAAIHSTFGFLWTGFYRVLPCQEAETGEMLVLGPFQGPVACSRIPYGKGVCGTAWKEARTVVVPDVEKFPGHIRCSSSARSEIVVPVFRDGCKITAVLDIDSGEPDTFDSTDSIWLEKICALL